MGSKRCRGKAANVPLAEIRFGARRRFLNNQSLVHARPLNMATLLFIVKLALGGLSPAKLVERARAIVAALTGNADFPTPTPTLAAVGAAADAVEAADTDVLNNGGKQDYLTRNLRVQELRNLLVLLGAYVQVTSLGDPEKILSAGNPFRKAPQPVGLVPAPGNLRAEVSKLVGPLDLRWGRVLGRMFYEGQMNETDPSVEAEWKPLVSQSDNTYSVKGLTSGKPYFFRVRAVGAAGPGPWSDPATEKPR